MLFGLRREVLEGRAAEPDELLAASTQSPQEDVQRVAQDLIGSNGTCGHARDRAVRRRGAVRGRTGGLNTLAERLQVARRGACGRRRLGISTACASSTYWPAASRSPAAEARPRERLVGVGQIPVAESMTLTQLEAALCVEERLVGAARRRCRRARSATRCARGSPACTPMRLPSGRRTRARSRASACRLRATRSGATSR